MYIYILDINMYNNHNIEIRVEWEGKLDKRQTHTELWGWNDRDGRRWSRAGYDNTDALCNGGITL